MGKAVFLNVSGAGHVIATYGMVAELVKRGEHVIYYEAPRYQAELEALGAEFRPYGPIRPFPGPQANYPYHHELDLPGAMTWCALELLPQLLDQVRQDQPDYIVHDALSVWGKVITQVLGIPGVTSIHTPAITWPVILGHDQIWSDLPKMISKGHRSVRYFLGLERQLRKTYKTPFMSWFDAFSNRQPINIAHAPPELQPCASLFGSDHHFVGSVHPRPESGNALLDRLEKELIYIGFGTICDPGPQFFRDCVEALGTLDMQVVMVLSHSTVPEDLGEIPPNFLVWSLRRDGLVPQFEILPRAKLFIMNGGNGGARESAWFSVPMIAVPPTFETDLISRCIQKQGAGIHLRPAEVTPSRIRQAVDKILADPSYRQNSARIGESCRRAGGGPRAAEIILDKLRGPRAADVSSRAGVTTEKSGAI